MRAVSAGASALGEGPVWDERGAMLLWVDIDGRQLHCLHAATGEQRDWPLPEDPGCIGLVEGAAPGEATRQVVIAMRSGFHRFDLQDAALTRVTDPPFDPARFRFNDGKVDRRGRFWAGTLVESKQGASAGLYCLERGRVRVVTGAGAAGAAPKQWGVTTSNGLAFSPDGRIMYHSDTPAHVVYAYDYGETAGSIAHRRVWWRADADRAAPGYGGRPDGAAVDVQGCYWTAQYEGGRVLQLSPQGQILQSIAVPARCPTMVAFGGPDLRTLYITSARAGRKEQELREFPLSGHVFSVPVDVPGLPSDRYLP